MHIERIAVRNFRLLHDVELGLDAATTVIVGRNNSGKTSLADVIRKFLGDKPSFLLHDFSSASYDRFCAALKAHQNGKPDEEIRALLPAIEMRVTVKYDPTIPEFGPLGDFIIDFDEAVDTALIVGRYALKGGAISALFDGHLEAEFAEDEGSIQEGQRLALFRDLFLRLPQLYALEWHAEDPGDPSNIKVVDGSAVRGLIDCQFINAQRGLDGTGSRESDVLAGVLEGLFASASLLTAEGEQRDIAESLERAVAEIQLTIDKDFKEQLQRLMPTIQSFGFPGLDGQELQTETSLDVQRLLSNNTKVRYKGYSNVDLPESYNGLGIRNLLMILFQIVGFYRRFRAQPEAPIVQLIFIEEPEAHLHPQMQEVFIRQLGDIAKRLRGEDPALWPVQFVVSTHSSHIANETPFSTIRYFIAGSKDQPVGVRCTTIKDLGKGLPSLTDAGASFLHQYLTLTRCDLFFADKAILIEGTTERILVPEILRKLDAERIKVGARQEIRAQYITLLEVGGAYAYLFEPLLKFLELKTLIVTDLDAVRPEKIGKTTKFVKRPVYLSKTTSNATLKRWFGKRPTPADLIAMPDADKVKEHIRIAYQLPETAGANCGRTFEDAFIFANPTLFSIKGVTDNAKADWAFDYVGNLKKSSFALRFATRSKDWTPPRYVSEGLDWLVGVPALADIDPNLALIAAAALAPQPDIPHDQDEEERRHE
ncbi:MAG: ATP-dependent endonuclease [Hyphomicrobiaceae bacterium]|nr:ATP-dependent endonuclease [Hyphomicrobiaceae bacterium]